MDETEISDIVEKNLRLMTAPVTEKSGLPYVAGSESFGGNAGTFNDYSCVAVNFHYDVKNGEIKVFSNDKIEPEMENLLRYNQFRMAVEWFDSEGNLSGKYRIIKYFISEKDNPMARVVLMRTVTLYNEMHGFEPVT